MELEKLKQILEAALMVAGGPLSFERINQLFVDDGDAAPSRDLLRTALEELENDYHHAGIELAKVGSGYRFQARAEVADWVSRLWEEKRPKYSRALLETLAIIAYRQPITRGEIEGIRGVAVSTNIIRTVLERDWVRIVGHRDVPGKPAVYATTRQFLDYFNLSSLAELPSLAELKDMDDVNADLFADANGNIEVRYPGDETSDEAANDGVTEEEVRSEVPADEEVPGDEVTDNGVEDDGVEDDGVEDDDVEDDDVEDDDVEDDEVSVTEKPE